MAEGLPSDNLYVQGLPDEFTTDAVNQFFSACGNVVQAKSIGHGCAMVRFSTVEEAATVKENLHGQQPVGCTKPMSITFATSKAHADWTCPRCGDLQFAKNNMCRKCGCPKGADDDPGLMEALQSWDGSASWQAPATVAAPAWGAGKSGKGKGGKGVVVAPPPAWGDSSSWAPAAQVKPDWIKDMPSAPGDWDCPSCGDLQFARNTNCRKCSCPKEGWGDAWGKAGGKKGGAPGPFGKAKGKGPGGFGAAPGIRGLIDGLIAEGLPGGDAGKDKNALYLTNLPHDTTDEDLYIIFATFGAIPPRGVRVMAGAAGQRTYGFVNFIDNANAEFAMMAMNGVAQPDGCKLFVKLKDSQKGGGKGAKAGAQIVPGLAASAATAATGAGIDTMMLQRLKAKLATGPMTSYDISQWYIIEYLGHVTEEEEMKTICDMLLGACSHLGLS